MKKIKRMLAFMLKNELMEIIEISIPKHSFQFIERTIDFNTMKLEFQIPANLYENPIEYERALEKAKKDMFKEVEKCMEIDTFPLISSNHYGKRLVRIILRVQSPKIN